MDYSNQAIIYPGSSFHVSHGSVTASQAPAAMTTAFEHPSQYHQQQQFLNTCPTASPAHHPFQQQQPFIQHQQSPYSANAAMYHSPSIHTTPVASNNSNLIIHEAQHAPTAPPLLMASSSSSTTTASSISSSSAEFLNEAFAKAASIPESFYPEFLQYSKETYEQSKGMNSHASSNNRKRQKRVSNERGSNQEQQEKKQQQRKQQRQESAHTDNESEDNEDNHSTISSHSTSSNNKPLTSTEIRRQIHIQSEQKRRAQIKDGFEELRNELPACLNKKMSKVALLHKTVQHIQHLKSTQMSILSELERLVHENEQLRKFQESVLQREALENLYTMSNNSM